jgi:hypothetical protein
MQGHIYRGFNIMVRCALPNFVRKKLGKKIGGALLSALEKFL